MPSARRNRWGLIATYAVLALAAAFVLFPLLWALSASFKGPTDVLASPPRWIPPTFDFSNYTRGLFAPKFLRYIGNSLLVVAGALVVSVGLAVHAAYAVSRFRFRGKDALLFIIWSTVMIPGVSIIVPLYLLAVDLKVYDTLFVVIIAYSAWLVPTLIWLLRGFIETVPYELEESALVDGCSRLKAFYVVVLPLLRPGLAAASVLVFVTIWNDFLLAFSLTLKDENRLLQVGLYSFVTELGIEWGPLMAATIGSTIPVVLAFALLQRQFIQGLTGGAVKG
ncbi:Diacetylchitobiose uptake system permease protein DasC [Usitatibacter rugosus]|uniref:Diacetylchitobiose uptake system permease protein DasC n=1 Tax=Usitatibacter rugosus TaxID=2732067 RepID=A0A6M4GQU9_9PROT|nr:carbohydrate ABC transporter permease [Usitatibacter rugosus]QJR09611.1 Diacetylchitobiose uptake system permease protein DasC [Usitatibacter rugosus]